MIGSFYSSYTAHLLGRASGWAKGLVLLICLLAASSQLHASHGLAGQITYENLGGNRYRITITTYTNPCSKGVDRPTTQNFVELWGSFNGNLVKINAPELQNIKRVNGQPDASGIPSGVILRQLPNGGCLKKNVYITEVTLNPGTFYEIRYYDFARVADLLNITDPGNTSFYISTQLGPHIGVDNSPVLLNDPIDEACINRLWTHNPAGYDADGDSLAYSLIPCQNYDPPTIPTPVESPGYRYPNAIGGNATNNQFSINPRTGIVTWKTPQQEGLYAIAILVREFRRTGIPGREWEQIGQVIRDMVIIVRTCTNHPPIIKTLLDTCVKPTHTLKFDVKVRDPDAGDYLFFYLSNSVIDTVVGQGAKFLAPEPFLLGANLNPPAGPFNSNREPQLTGQEPNPNLDTTFYPIKTTVSWPIVCGLVRTLPYQIDYYAHDSSANLNSGPELAANAVTTIRVLGPAVQGVTATAGASRSVMVSWNKASCTNVLGYQVYRSLDSLGLGDTLCCTGGAGSGYQLIRTLNSRDSTSFVDGPNLPFRPKYCYRVVALYTDLGTTLTVPGCPSAEACVRLRLDIPIPLKVNVDITGKPGQISLRWRNPNFTLLNPVQYPRPFTYRVWRAAGSGNFQRLKTPILTTTDTVYTDATPNTVDSAYTYRFDLVDAVGDSLGSATASSIYLSATGINKAVQLSWAVQVPWLNDKYVVYRATSINGPYSALDSVPVAVLGQEQLSYQDKRVVVGKQYCYYVRSVGSYRDARITTQVLQDSSERMCAVPVDTIPPCLPPFQSTVDCANYAVHFAWSDPPDSCGATIARYDVYFKRFPNNPYTQIGSVPRGPAGTAYTFDYKDPQLLTIAGCYAFKAVDSLGNQSKFSPAMCLGNNCPEFQLPNVFTPNGDGLNDYFAPLTYDPFSIRAVGSVVCYIYDRWGRELYVSHDKTKLWDGTVGGTPAPTGTYYYTVQITFESLQPNDVVWRTGSVTLIR